MKGPISQKTPVRFSAPLPETADVVVIGGGVIGVFAALYLRRAGLSVVLCEKGRVAGEQSSRNWGWIRQLGRDPAELPIATEATALWREIDTATGGGTGYRQNGVTYLASDETEMARLARWLPVARAVGLDVHQLDRLTIQSRFAGHARATGWHGALYCPTDGCAEPWQAVPAVAALAQSEGVVVRENCAVRGLETHAGLLCGVVTEAGAVSCGRAILAGGAWSSLFARRHAISLAQLAVRSTAARTAPLPAFFDGNAVDEELAFRRRADGGYTLALGEANQHFIGPDSFRALRLFLPLFRTSLKETRLRPGAPHGFPDAWSTARNWRDDRPGPFEAMPVLEPRPAPGSIARIRKLFAERFPGIGAPEIVNSWAGMIDVTPDLVPVVDRVAALPGLTIATGMCGHGFGIGPAFGKIAAALAREVPTGHDLSAFSLARFEHPRDLRIGANL